MSGSRRVAVRLPRGVCYGAEVVGILSSSRVISLYSKKEKKKRLLPERLQIKQSVRTGRDIHTAGRRLVKVLSRQTRSCS